jgi:hypothetical protein
MTRLVPSSRLLLAAAFLLFSAAPALTADLTIKPMHVHALWQNVNECLVTTVRTTTTKIMLIGEIRDMEPAAFEGKTSADLYERTRIVREKIERVRAKMGADAWAEQLDVGTGEVLPMHTYLAAGMALDGVASLLVAKTGPEQAVNVCYKAELADGKTESDAYSLIDLADRRLDAVIKALGA